MDILIYIWAAFAVLFLGFQMGYHYGDRDAREEIRARLDEVREHMMAAHGEDFKDESDNS